MNVNSVCLCVLVLSLLFECGHSKSPCPDIFNFFTDGKNVFGQITLQPVETVFSLEIRITYAVQANLDNYLGRIDSPDDVLDKYNRGETVRYRVYFPVISPLPKVTEIAVNGYTICTGPRDKFVQNHVISRPSLLLTTSYGVGSGPPAYKRFRHQPQTTTLQPLTTSVHHHDYADEFPQYIKALKASSPYVVMNNSHPVTQQSTAARSTPTNTTTTTLVYSTPVKNTTRPEQTFPNTSITMEECGVVAGDIETSRLIQNGPFFVRGDIPWLVAIYKKVKKTLQFICGGTLVSDRHVVTAAHCIQGSRDRIPEKTIVVKIGAHDLNAWSDDIVVTAELMAATIHESFNGSSLENDIMILTLNKHVEFNDFIRPICLWGDNTELSRVVGANGVVAGWGDTDSGEPLMQRVPIVSTKECRYSTPDFYKFTSYNTLCAGSRNGDGPCKGDSGGGLYLNHDGKWRLRGVVSLFLQNGHRESACNLNEYVVYTDAAQYLPWIRNVLLQKYSD